MQSHKFAVGEIVAFRPVNRNTPTGVFEVIEQLPGDGESEYRSRAPTNRISA
jgi:hypothetical protein